MKKVNGGTQLEGYCPDLLHRIGAKFVVFKEVVETETENREANTHVTVMFKRAQDLHHRSRIVRIFLSELFECADFAHRGFTVFLAVPGDFYGNNVLGNHIQGFDDLAETPLA